MSKKKLEDKEDFGCLKCGCRLYEVLKTVQYKDRIYRRRQCRYCGHRMSTVEKIIQKEESD